MPRRRDSDSTAAFEAASNARTPAPPRSHAPSRSKPARRVADAPAPDAMQPVGFVLKLYVAGATSKSSLAIQNIQRICEEHLAGQYKLEIVDLYQQPAEAARGQVLAAPTLVREECSPPRRMVGDMSDEARVLAGLGLSVTPPRA